MLNEERLGTLERATDGLNEQMRIVNFKLRRLEGSTADNTPREVGSKDD